MSWKENIERQLKNSSSKQMNPELKKFAKELLNFDDEFSLRYLSGRDVFLGLKFKVKMKRETKLFILRNYDINVLKFVML